MLKSLLKGVQTLSVSSQRCYAFKSDLKIKWVRPAKIPCIKPEKSGDLDGFKPVDPKRVLPEFEGCKELETADDAVKKLFTVEFAPRWRKRQINSFELQGLVRRHEQDGGSPEVKIARMTATIRSLQEIMEQFPRNRVMKVRLKELIDKRKKQLKYLRRWDYKRFEWILEKLNIVYKAPPNEFHWITRKDSLKKLTDKYCDEVRTKKLEEYKASLKKEQPTFLEEKVKLLKFMRQEQIDCGVEPTVSIEEIEETERRLEECLQNQVKNASVVE